MRRSSVLLPAIVATLACWLVVPSARAQSLDYTLPYNRPALSPWLDMFRADTGVLPNYQQFVRPQQRLQRTLQNQELAIRQQQARLQILRQQTLQPPRDGATAPTGTGATFLNYSHYFPGMGAAGRR